MEDLTGRRFGRLFVTANGPDCRCICDCGATVKLRRGQLLSGKTKSCGCLRRDMAAVKQKSHGMSASPEYSAWQNAKNRCERPADIRYPLYGGRGIKMKFRTFAEFFAEVGPRPDGMTLDRIDPDGDYAPGNVRWASVKDQARNRRSIRMVEVDGVEYCLAELAEKCGQPLRRVYDRMRSGWGPIVALACPPGQERINEADAIAILHWAIEARR